MTATSYTSMIHAYDAPPVQPPQPLHVETELPEPGDTWKGRASHLLCCFTSPSSGYYMQPGNETPSTASTRRSGGWGQSTGELRIYSQPTNTSQSLLGPQTAEHAGRLTLVLDLDGALPALRYACILLPCTRLTSAQLLRAYVVSQVHSCGGYLRKGFDPSVPAPTLLPSGRRKPRPSTVAQRPWCTRLSSP
jgi:hypothetical protein